MRVPYFIQGFFFAPAVAGLLFLLKITCPASTGYGCFADNFLPAVFMPLNFLYTLFARTAPTLAHHEPVFILGYWALVGFVAGLLVDLWRIETKREGN